MQLAGNPFVYRRQRHVRTESPGVQRRYQDFKPFLRREFRRKCIYCRISDGIRGAEAFGVEHYRPKARFPEDELNYANLFYACNPCNQRKGDFWPDAVLEAADVFIPNPCDHGMGDHVECRGAEILAHSTAGTFLIARLRLDSVVLINLRGFILRQLARILNAEQDILKTIAALSPRIANLGGEEQRQAQQELALLQTRLQECRQDLYLLTGEDGSEEGAPP